MSKWEDIVKDKLKGYESTLPDDGLDAFHDAHRAAASTTKARRSPLIWAIAPAIAAGLAVVLLLRKPTVPEEGVQLIPQLVETYSQVDDSPDATTPPVTAPLVAQSSRTNDVRPPRETAQPEEMVATTVVEEIRIPEEPPSPEVEDIGTEDSPEESAADSRPVISDSSPFVPQPSTAKPAVQVSMGTGGTITACGGFLAALATQLARADVTAIPGIHNTDPINAPGDIASHCIPLIVGLSVKCPVTEKIGITTGLDYSLYSSSFSCPTEKQPQLVHYLGIPVRLDWIFATGKGFDAYLGAGIKGDYCLGATLAGESIGKDGPAFRLLGAGGIQFNATRTLSLFVEPEISWTLPSDHRILSTYSIEHPWMATVATGLRINLGK